MFISRTNPPFWHQLEAVGYNKKQGGTENMCDDQTRGVSAAAVPFVVVNSQILVF